MQTSTRSQRGWARDLVRRNQLRWIVLLGALSTSASALERPLQTAESHLPSRPQPINQCTSKTKRSLEQILLTKPVLDGALQFVAVHTGERLCLRIVRPNSEGWGELELVSDGKPAHVVVIFEARESESFSLLRIENRTAHRLGSYYAPSGSTWPYEDLAALSPYEQRHWIAKGPPGAIVLRFRVPSQPQRPIDGRPAVSSEPRLEPQRQRAARGPGGFRAGGLFGYSVRPLQRVTEYLDTRGYEPFPLHRPRVGAYLGATLERMWIEVSLALGSARAPHQERKDVGARLWELSGLLEMGVGVSQFGGLVIYPYGGLGLHHLSLRQDDSHPVTRDPLPEGVDEVSASGVSLGGGIGFGQMIVHDEVNGMADGLTVDLRFGYQQQVARSQWGYHAIGEEGRQSAGRAPRVNLSAVMMTLAIGAGRRTLKWHRSR